MKTKREKLEARLAALKNERSSWEPAWKDITEQLTPYRSRWYAQDRNRGEKKDSKTLNSRPIHSVKVLSAGMVAGITSPGRKWFGLAPSDPDLGDSKAVRVFLDKLQRDTATVLQNSNWYRALSAAVYPDLIGPGTAAMFQEEQPGRGFHYSPMPVGEFYLDANFNDEIDTCFREVRMSVRQIVARFGLKAVSQPIREAYDRGNYHAGFVIGHAVQPNDEYQDGKIGRLGMRFSSCWWEVGGDRHQGLLSEGGYESFPVLAPRWTVLAGDVYGRGPGWDVRGDCRVLQHYERRLLEMLDKTVNPPLRSRGDVKRASLLPGDVTELGGKVDATVEPIMTVPPQAIELVREHIMRTEARIQEQLFANLWQMLIQDERAQRPTATEVEAKRQEVALMLGPLLENLNNELLEPAINRIVERLVAETPPEEIPEELQGQDVKVEFQSIMHQMQQATGLVGIRTLMQEVANVAAIRPDVVDKVDADVLVDELGRITGVPPDAILSKEEVTKVRQVRAEHEQAQRQGEAMLAATEGARNLSGADPMKLSELAQMMPPAASAQAGALGGVRSAA